LVCGNKASALTTQNLHERDQMAVKQLPLTGPVVKKSNVLARATWSPESIWETRLIALVAAKIRVDDKDFAEYEIPVSELLQQHGGGRDYQELLIVIDRVMSRVLTIKEENGWVKYNIFSRCRYLLGLGVVQVSFHPDLKPHFLNLKERFVQYNLIEYMLLPSVYSQRIYEFLMSWKGVAEYEISVEELHEMLDTPETYRKDFNVMRCRILDKAQTDITTKTLLDYVWEPIKKGRRVVAIKFIFDRKKIKQDRKDVEKEAKQALVNANNKIALEVVRCTEQKQGKCQRDNKKSICEACEKMGMAPL
jgi:plasmid replication initiation protein